MALAEKGQQYKVKHSRNSQIKLGDARATLAMVHTLGDEFAAEVKRLCETKVTTTHWGKFLDAHVPLVTVAGERLTGRAATIAEKKRAGLQKLYTHDLRVAPWAGTAHGVLQAVNTFEHHEGTVRGTTRAERNMLRAVTGDWDSVDRTAYLQLAQVLAVHSFL